MGRKTYELVGGPLEGLNYIRVLANAVASRLSRRDRNSPDNGIEEVRRLRSQEGRDIWFVGGGGLFGSLVAARLVDRVELGVMPVLLGEGIPVMSGMRQRVKLNRTGDLSTWLLAVSR